MFIGIAIITFVFIASLMLFILNLPSMKNYYEQQNLLERVNVSYQDEDESSLRKELILSKNPFVNQLLAKYNYFIQVAVILEQAKSPFKVIFFIILSLSLLFISPIIFVFFNLPLSLGIVLGIILFMIPFFIFSFLKKKRLTRFESAFPEMISTMRMALTSGQGVQSAFEMIGKDGQSPVKEEFEIINQKINLGVDFYAAMRSFAFRNDLPEVHFFVSSVLIQKDSGGDLANVLESIELMIRQRFSFKRELGVLSAQGKMSGIVLAMIPIGIALILLYINPEYIKFFVREEAGKYMLIVIFILNFFGGLWIKKIVDVKVY